MCSCETIVFREVYSSVCLDHVSKQSLIPWSSLARGSAKHNRLCSIALSIEIVNFFLCTSKKLSGINPLSDFAIDHSHELPTRIDVFNDKDFLSIRPFRYNTIRSCLFSPHLFLVLHSWKSMKLSSPSLHLDRPPIQYGRQRRLME